jgi:hypothetical protein
MHMPSIRVIIWGDCWRGKRHRLRLLILLLHGNNPDGVCEIVPVVAAGDRVAEDWVLRLGRRWGVLGEEARLDLGCCWATGRVLSHLVLKERKQLLVSFAFLLVF